MVKGKTPPAGTGTVEKGEEEREAYCARLGHFVPLRYCLKPAQETPCFRIKDCWWQIFDIVSYLEKNLDKEVFDGIMAEVRPPSRMSTILGVIDELKRGDEGDDERGGRRGDG